MLDKETQVLPARSEAWLFPGYQTSWHGRAGCATLPLVAFAEIAYRSNPNTFLFSEAHRGLCTAQCITWSLPILDLGHGTSRRTCSARRQAVMLSMAASERREHRNSTLIPGEGREEASKSSSRLLDKSTAGRHTQRLCTRK